MLINITEKKLYLKGDLFRKNGEFNDELVNLDFNLEQDLYDNGFYLANYRLDRQYSNNIFRSGDTDAIIDAVKKGTTLKLAKFTKIEDIKKHNN